MPICASGQDVVVDPNDTGGNIWYACVFEGWGTSGIQGTGGLFRTTNQGQSWTRINDNFRVNSCSFKPGSPGEVYFTTETDGLWYSSDASAAVPHFTQVSSYPFRHPMRVFFSPYNSAETWVTSFGDGIKLGGNSPSGIDADTGSGSGFSLYPNPCHEEIKLKFRDAPSSADYYYSVSDITGRKVIGGRCSSLPETRINASSLANGMYIVKVYSRDGAKWSTKLLKR